MCVRVGLSLSLFAFTPPHTHTPSSCVLILQHLPWPTLPRCLSVSNNDTSADDGEIDIRITKRLLDDVRQCKGVLHQYLETFEPMLQRRLGKQARKRLVLPPPPSPSPNIHTHTCSHAFLNTTVLERSRVGGYILISPLSLVRRLSPLPMYMRVRARV